MNFLVIYILSLGISSVSKLGLLFYKMHFISERGYGLRIKNVHDLLLILNLNSGFNLLKFLVPMINILKELQNLVLYETNKERFFNEMLEKNMLVSKNCHTIFKHSDYESCNVKSDTPPAIVSQRDCRAESLDKSPKELKPKVYVKVKK